MRQRVVVGVSGSLGSLTALHQAVSEARERGAELCAVLAWQLPGGGLGSRTGGLGAETFRECRAAARAELCAALDMAFAVERPGIALSGFAVRGDPRAVLVDAVRSADDLLVVGMGSRGRRFPGLRTPVARYCLAHAPCPVLAVPPHPLEAELASARRTAWRLPLMAREQEQ
ncbi:universal stress protein [Streptomyces sp. NPDC008163]|uniref:universal stress protein n=1 Tax=Streptomyces sp. NPDC008163 TaxID=3364818 RepID=UPI0036F07B49